MTSLDVLVPDRYVLSPPKVGRVVILNWIEGWLLLVLEKLVLSLSRRHLLDPGWPAPSRRDR
jgi:hypothetical protein